jgi:hypothetical protein
LQQGSTQGRRSRPHQPTDPIRQQSAAPLHHGAAHAPSGQARGPRRVAARHGSMGVSVMPSCVLTLTGTRPWARCSRLPGGLVALSYCPRSSLPVEVLAWLAGRLVRLARLLARRPRGQGANPPLALECAWTPSPRSCLMGCRTGAPARAVGIFKTTWATAWTCCWASWPRSEALLHLAIPRQVETAARGVPEVGRLSCCAFVFVDQAAEDVTAAELPAKQQLRLATAV